MWNDIERAELGEVFRAHTKGEDVRIFGFLDLTEDRIGRKVVLELRVAHISTEIEVAELLRSVETHAVEVRIVVDLDAVAHGIAVSLTHIESKTDGCTAGGGVVKT